MRVVLDASAAIEVLLNRADARSLEPALGDASETVAPDLILAESANALWKFHRFEALDLNICDDALRRLAGLVDRLVPSVELYREAFDLSRALRRPVYDMFYLALARREDAALLTLDKGLKKDAKGQGIRVL